LSAIFGLVAVGGDGLPGRTLEAMRSALADHGGDGGGVWALGGAGLGQQLKLTTPEDRFERQPVVSADGLRVLVSDGRIDNRPELCRELGLPARAVPDSAFILAAYERWGTDCGQHLIGAFSFAIWDAGLKRLLLLQSPFGAKPLFFHRAAGFFAFAAMPRALFALPGVPPRVARGQGRKEPARSCARPSPHRPPPLASLWRPLTKRTAETKAGPRSHHHHA
jgi:asparagine synthase (glutamine-hydrolysing)